MDPYGDKSRGLAGLRVKLTAWRGPSTPVARPFGRGPRCVASVLAAVTCCFVALFMSGVWRPFPGLVPQRVQFKSIDTTKYSRDLAEQMLSAPFFDTIIDQQISEIARSRADYVAVDTPYDEHFLPFLKRWVDAARRYHLKVWYRGNFSGWEGWFNYPRIDRSEHQQMMNDFILSHPDLFRDGDIFTPCPECENGGPGDPRQTGDVAGYRAFMALEYEDSQRDFGQIGRAVISNYNSMNYDVASLIMDKPTTTRLGGIVTIDHYVTDPKDLVAGIDALAESSGGRIVVGEFGAPIPSINGEMSQDAQARWISEALQALATDHNVAGWNYWTSVGGSTALWTDGGEPRKAASVLQRSS